MNRRTKQLLKELFKEDEQQIMEAGMSIQQYFLMSDDDKAEFCHTLFIEDSVEVNKYVQDNRKA